MSKRNSKSIYYDDHIPLLVRYYRDIHKAVFGHSAFVPVKFYSKFKVMEDDLRDLGATPLEYADISINMLKKWAASKGLNYIPINVFCGEWLFNKFVKVYRSETVDISKSKDVDAVLYSELLVARTYVSGDYSDFHSVVDDLRPLLDDDWIQLYDAKNYRFCTGDALDILCQEYGFSYANDYDNLRKRLNEKHESI